MGYSKETKKKLKEADAMFKPVPRRKRNKTSKRQSKQEFENKWMSNEPRYTTGTDKPYNDAAWYTRNKTAADAAAKIINNYVAGSPVFQYMSRVESNMKKSAIPGLMTIDLKHTVGATQSNISAINLAAKHKFTEIRLKNTGSQLYEANDLMMYFLTMDGLYSAYALATKIYRSLNLFETMNLYYPNAILRGLGMDQTGIRDFRSHAADFHYWLIKFADQLNTFKVPADIDLYKRHFFLYTNVFTDGSDVKSGLIQFRPSKMAIDTWTENADPDMWRGNFTLTPTIMPLTSYETFVTYMDTLLDRVRRSEDFFNIMNADMLKVYGESGCFHVTPPAAEEKLSVMYSEEVLSQIQNAFVVRLSDTDLMNSVIFQDVETNTIRQSIKFDSQYGGYTPLVNFRTAIPSVDSIFVATRLTPILTDTGTEAILESSGTEVATAIRIMTITYSADGGMGYVENELYSVVSNDPGPTGVTYLARLSMFKDHPIIYAVQADDAGDNEITAVFGDLDNYTILGRNTLYGLHDTAIYSLFNVFSKF